LPLKTLMLFPTPGHTQPVWTLPLFNMSGRCERPIHWCFPHEQQCYG